MVFSEKYLFVETTYLFNFLNTINSLLLQLQEICLLNNFNGRIIFKSIYSSSFLKEAVHWKRNLKQAGSCKQNPQSMSHKRKMYQHVNSVTRKKSTNFHISTNFNIMLTMLAWNKAFWLFKICHMTWNLRSFLNFRAT